MPRFVEGDDGSQSRLDDWVAQDNSVRVIDVFINELDLGVLGTGRASNLPQSGRSDILIFHGQLLSRGGRGILIDSWSFR
jgi:hypothetical protein